MRCFGQSASVSVHIQWPVLIIQFRLQLSWEIHLIVSKFNLVLASGASNALDRGHIHPELRLPTGKTAMPIETNATFHHFTRSTWKKCTRVHHKLKQQSAESKSGILWSPKQSSGVCWSLYCYEIYIHSVFVSHGCARISRLLRWRWRDTFSLDPTILFPDLIQGFWSFPFAAIETNTRINWQGFPPFR